MSKPIESAEEVEACRVICPACAEKFWEPSKGYIKCPLCGGDTHGAVFTEGKLIYPVLIDPLTGAAILGPPRSTRAKEVQNDG